jgi:rhodanese-related sulfurtransferase
LETDMNKTHWIAPLVAALLIACGGDDGTDTDTGSGGDGGAMTSGSGGNSAGSGGNGGSASSGGGNMADPCEGITPMRNILTPEQLLDMLDAKDFALINVHVPYAGEIPGTDAHIPYTDVDAIEEHLGHDKGAKVVLYCRTGPMSQIAGDELVDRGYCRLSDMSAGSYQWEQLGYPYTP